MNIDLEMIAEENIKRYGTDIDKYGPVLLAHLYSDKTHFVFELLQNAEDAQARVVNFRLYHDRLEFEHDGRPFNEGDVRGICGLVSGTKKDDITKIGRFGIGFKSVFAYTASPQIHCQELHFCIENYVLPKRLPQLNDDYQPKTCFVFPFNCPLSSASEAYSQIRERLSELGSRTLLFLKNVKRIECTDENATMGTFSRAERGSAVVRHVQLQASMYGVEEKEKWLVFRTPLTLPKDSEATGTNIYVEIGYLVRADQSGSEHVVDIAESPLVVFFPTEKETGLSFLVQGPYVTTPARDNVPPKDPWNIHLVNETSKLACSSLHLLKSMGLLDSQTIEVMPLNEYDFPEGTMFYPIAAAVRTTLWRDELIPALGGGHIAGERGKLAKGADIPRLFNPKRLKELLKLTSMPKWISTDITPRKTPRLHTYLTTARDSFQSISRSAQTKDIAIEIDIKTIAEHISAEFMQEQPDSWVRDFYAYLGTQNEYYRELKTKPILRTQCGQHLPAYDDEGTPKVFIPSRSSTGYTIIKRTLAKDPDVRILLDGLQVRTPDLTSEVLTQIIPTYSAANEGMVPKKRHLEDLEKIAAALRSDSELVWDLEDMLRQTPFVRAKNAKNGRASYQVPSETYIRTRELELYFATNRNAWFLDEDSSVDINWVDLGVRAAVKVSNENPSRDGHVIVTSDGREYRRGIDGFDPECEFFGLELAIKNTCAELSSFIWNHLLVPNKRSISGILQKSTSYAYRTFREEARTSPMGQLVLESPWLPGKNGTYCAPHELGADEIPESFQRDEELIAKLGMRPASIGVLAKETGISVDILAELRRNPGLFEEFSEWKRNQVLVSSREDIAEEDEETWSLDGEASESSVEKVEYAGGESLSSHTPSDGPESRVDYFNLLSQEFARTRKGDRVDSRDFDDNIGSKGIKNIARRKEKLEIEITDSIANAPSETARRKNTERSLIESVDPMVRQSLYEWYQGCCQICGETFPDRTGRPFFVAGHIVERRHAAWLNNPANVVCLCPDHFAKWRHAVRETSRPLPEQIQNFSLRIEGNVEAPSLSVFLCGKQCSIKYSDPHALALRVLLENFTSSDD